MRKMSDSLGHRRRAHGYKFGYVRPRKLSVIFVEMSGNVSIFQGLLKGLWIGEVRRGERKCGFCGCRDGVRSPECCGIRERGGTLKQIQPLKTWQISTSIPLNPTPALLHGCIPFRENSGLIFILRVSIRKEVKLVFIQILSKHYVLSSPINVGNMKCEH